jgi:hypothetical protein
MQLAEGAGTPTIQVNIALYMCVQTSSTVSKAVAFCTTTFKRTVHADYLMVQSTAYLISTSSASCDAVP